MIEQKYLAIVVGFTGPTCQLWHGMRTDGNGKPQAHLKLIKLDPWESGMSLRELETKYKAEIEALRHAE